MEIYLGYDGNCIKPGFRDLYGNPIKRTPYSHPYSYDEYVVYKNKDFNENDYRVCSDRLLEWNTVAFENAVREVWPQKPDSQMFYDKKPEDLNRFLILYFKKDVKLTAVLQGCNASSGYPYWIFIYKE